MHYLHRHRLHSADDQDQVSAIQAGLKQQIIAFAETRGVLDSHTGHNKEHQQQLQAQMLEVQRHRQEVEQFTAQLDELKRLRAAADKLKLEQAERQTRLEKQHREEIQGFDKEPQQQRARREMEFTAQAESNKTHRRSCRWRTWRRSSRCGSWWIASSA